MRLTDHRYVLERQKLDVALRMIRLEARTQTIRACTGLSEHRVRMLYTSYVAHAPDSQAIKRRRGKSPRQIESVLRTAHTQQEASLLAGAMATLGLLRPRSPDETQQVDAELGDQLCDAYEVYVYLLADKPLSFEHAWFLWRELNRESDLCMRPCPECGGLNVQDRLTVRTRQCPWCGAKRS